MNKNKKNILPFVSICTPTYNRREFIPNIIKCVQNQTYPKDRIEWVIIDDGTDKIEDLIKDISFVKYFKYDEKMKLGKKRNLMHDKTKGDILIYMDDDDYYPNDRVEHAVTSLINNPKILMAGSSEMFCYFKHIDKIYKTGPYGPNHATAGTFAFKRALLKQTKYDNEASSGEEKFFLKNHTIPVIQLDPMKSILVIAHNSNTFDKQVTIEKKNELNNVTKFKLTDFVQDEELIKFYTKDNDINFVNSLREKNISLENTIKEHDTLATTIIMENTLLNETCKNIYNKMNNIEAVVDMKSMKIQTYFLEEKEDKSIHDLNNRYKNLEIIGKRQYNYVNGLISRNNTLKETLDKLFLLVK